MKIHKQQMSLALVRSLLVTGPLILVCTLIMGTISYFLSFLDQDGRRQHRLAQVWAKMLLVVSGVRVTVEGLEKLDLSKSYVFVSNHTSYMDTPIVIASIPVQFRFMAKSSLFKIPVMGSHLTRAGHVPVVREDPRASLRSMSDAAKTLREKGFSVLVFPEGGRTPDGELKEFREGAAYIGIKAATPVVPIALVGSREVLPMHSLCVRGRRVKIRIGDVISTGSMHLRERGELTSLLRREILRMLGQLAPDAQQAG